AWRPEGTVVPVLDKDNRVRYRPVQVGRDYGLGVEVVSGLQGDETVIVRPGDALTEGQVVEPAAAAKEPEGQDRELTTKPRLTAPFVVALLLLAAEPAHSQSPRRQQRLAALQQQNALQAQQSAVQTAVLQTNALLQASGGGAPQVGLLNGAVRQAGAPNP